MEEIKKRNINPDRKPGPDPKFGEVKSRTIILKLTQPQFEMVEDKRKDKSKTQYLTDLIEGD